MDTIAIVDYGIGNLASIKNMFKRIEVKNVIISSDKSEIKKASKLILPGVGAFDNGMSHLEKYDLIDVLNEKALNEKVPVLGICLGMQLMTKGSEEGNKKGLSWFDAETIKFKFEEDSHLKIPHMGWNYVEDQKPELHFLKQNKRYRFYFVHSYFVQCASEENVLFTTQYGINFSSAIIKNNIIGMQFHPEKSLHFGMDIFEKFAAL